MIKKVYELSTFDKLRPTDKKLSGAKLVDVFNDRNEKYLDNNFNGWVSILPSLKGYIMYIDHWTIETTPVGVSQNLRFHYTKYYKVGSLTINSSSYSMSRDDLPTLEITKYIEKEPRIIISEKDPWGEEDWDEYITEQMGYYDDNDYSDYELSKPKDVVFKKEKTFKFKDFLRFDLLSLRKLEALRDNVINEIIIIKQGKNNIKGRVVRIKPIKLGKNEEYYEFTLVTKNGNRNVTVTKDDEFKVKIPKTSKIDPYNEDEWDLYI